MVQSINKKDRTITVTMYGDIEELCNRQSALIELLRNYDYENYGNSCSEMVSNCLDLLCELLPDYKTQKRGFETAGEYLVLPNELTENGKELIKEAIYMINHKGVKVRNEPNPIYEILKTK